MASNQAPISYCRSSRPSPFGILLDMSATCFPNPINWLVRPIIEVDWGQFFLRSTTKKRMTTSIIQTGSRVGEVVNDRSRNLEKFQGVEEATLDLYTAVRNAYLQKRSQAIRE